MDVCISTVDVGLDVGFDVDEWLDAHWDPDLTVEEWWQVLARAGLSHPALPAPWGRGWSVPEVTRLVEAMVARGALGPPLGMGLVMGVPTLLTHAAPTLRDALVPRILNGQDGWCQLFSEPGAGSDLASIQTRAERDGDEWVITGQKVWTSLGQWADYGMLLARTDAEAPKHQGITYFALPMRQPGVTVRPLREMSGRAMFNEVFLDEARVRVDHVVGDVGGGWRVANTTLNFERGGIGGGNNFAPSGAVPGTIAGHLERRAGSFATTPPPVGDEVVGLEQFQSFVGLARANGAIADASIRQDLMRLRSALMIQSWHVARMQAGGATTGGEGNMAKLRNSDITRMARDVGCRILGPHAMVTGADSASGGEIQALTVLSPAPSIYGGTDQVQRNIIGERVLGLPREPGPPRDTPFRDLLQNTAATRDGRR
ncbi:MAG: Acyl-CoA dehydrogenase [Ilumatobacteraceae bacterium]|nr:Acyl-CoA dehydrogenase [Ilumatobacteraceae bacterium]